MKLLYTIGLPASGKTTQARKLQSEDKTLVRVNKDDLRAMLHTEFNKNNETFTVAVRDAIIGVAAKFNRDIICDDTNLNKSHQRRFLELARQHNMSAVHKITIQPPIYVCMDRDKNRAKPVGDKVIKDMSQRYGKQLGQDSSEWMLTEDVWKNDLQPYVSKPEYPSAIICDIDGTVAIITDRNPYDTAKCEQDQPNYPITTIVKHMSQDFGWKLFFFSGREEKYKPQTMSWLMDNGFLPDDYELFMRQTGDFRPDDVVKKELFDRVIRDKYHIMAVFDDRDQVVKLWRNLGLTCLQVADGQF